MFNILEAQWTPQESWELDAQSQEATLWSTVRGQVPHHPGQVQAVPPKDPAQTIFSSWSQASPLVVCTLPQNPRLQQITEHLPSKEASNIGDRLENLLDFL